MNINVNKLVLSLFLAFLPGWIGSYFTYSKIPTWYASLQKPEFSPPNFIFGPVWTILYILIGISLYLVWNKKVSGKLTRVKKQALQIFSAQLVLNGLWSIVFFGAEQLFLGIVVILSLWITIFLSIRYFLKISKPAAYILIPYLLWVSFATILNAAVFSLN